MDLQFLSCVLVIAVLPFCESGRCPGVCQSNTLPCQTQYTSGLCLGGNSIECCVESSPSCTATSEQCQANTLSCNGTYVSGICPGNSAVECCQSLSVCGGKTLFKIGKTPVMQLTGDGTSSGGGAFYWTSKLDVDADGSPNAYNPQDTGIDYLANAGHPGNWWGISTDSSGTPFVQAQYPSNGYAPYPGYYVSTTSLEDRNFPEWDPRRFANAVNLTFIVLPGSTSIRGTGAKVGDLAYIYWAETGKNVYAIYGDVGPSSSIGEASVATHMALENNPYGSSGRVTNGIDSGVWTIVFPGSGSGKLLTQEQINTLGAQAFNNWGGQARFDKCILEV